MTALNPAARSAVMALGLMAITATGAAHAQAPAKAQTKKEAGKAEPAARRLPPGYGQIGLSAEQREKVYAVQEKYAAQLAKLNQEIADLREKITSESEAVLTPAQRAQLNANRAEAKSKTKAAAKREPKAKTKAKAKD